MSTFQGSLRVGVAAFALAIATVCAASPALAQGNITLPSASLEDSLNALSRRSGAQILVDQTLLRGKKAPAVRGASSPAAALNQLLRGTGLGYEKRGDAYLIVRGAHAAQVAAPGAAGSRAASERGTGTLLASSDQDGNTDEPIVVTGSRIARPELESAMPISVVNMEQAERFGRTTAYDALLRESSVGVGIGPASSQGQSWDAGISTVSLRNLGTNRSLTLIDGMRRVSGSAQSSAVDLGMIPGAMIERIEVVTGGAAAIYGADAVTGAVNVITKRDYQGLEISAQNGISAHGDMNRLTAAAMASGSSPRKKQSASGV